MPHTLEVQTTVLPGHRIEICSPELPEGCLAKVVVIVEDAEPAPTYTAPAAFAAAERRFLADLPQLLQSKAGRWMAYGPEGCLAEGEDWSAVFQECHRQGLPCEELYIARVQLPIDVIDDRSNGVVEAF